MSQVVSMRFQDHQIERLHRMARRLGRTPSETGALLIEESLRQSEFGHIDFRNSPVGRQAHIKGSSLAVWELALIAHSYEMNITQTANHLQWPLLRVQAALNYAASFPEEIGAAIEDAQASDFGTLSRMLPHAEEFTVNSSSQE